MTFCYIDLLLAHISYMQIPSTVVLSDDCRNLLENLLQRNPEKRMSFDEFFEHPFIDLEHAPTSECLPKAVSMDGHYHPALCIIEIIIQRTLVTKAVTNDSEGNLGLAINFYIQALEYFIPALECEFFSISHCSRMRIHFLTLLTVEEDQATKDALKVKVCYLVNT